MMQGFSIPCFGVHAYLTSDKSGLGVSLHHRPLLHCSLLLTDKVQERAEISARIGSVICRWGLDDQAVGFDKIEGGLFLRASVD